MSGHHHKLNQLDGGHILFPPQVLLVGGSQCGESIVGVHDDMDDAVQEGVESSQTTWGKFDSKPPGEGHDGVMVDMQESYLAVLFPQDKENLYKKEKKVRH